MVVIFCFPDSQHLEQAVANPRLGATTPPSLGGDLTSPPLGGRLQLACGTHQHQSCLQRLSFRPLVSVPCHRIPCTAADKPCGPAAWACRLPGIRCRRRLGISAQSDLQVAFSSESPVLDFDALSRASLMAVNLAGALTSSSAPAALTARADDPAVLQRRSSSRYETTMAAGGCTPRRIGLTSEDSGT